jgi:hypothetical protein
MRRTLNTLAATLLAVGTVVTVAAGASSVAAAATKASCGSLTKSLITTSGFSGATGPVVTPYNYKKISANQANALGTTYDFGPKAIVISCVAPSDISRLSILAQGSMKKPMNATAYMNYLVKQAAGAMKKTPVGGVSDYLDFGNGKEDGVGSLAKAGSIRLDAWVAHNYIFLTFSQPATATPSTGLLNLIKYTTTHF